MQNKILVYCWGTVFEPQLIRAIKENKIECIEFREKIKYYHADAEFAAKLIQVIHKEKVDAVISYDYFPIISILCEINQIPYVSWVFDCPQYTLYSKTILNKMNYIFCFDAILTERIQALGASHVYHFPLAADIDKYQNIVRTQKSDISLQKKYECDISFVGNLYNGKYNRFRDAALPKYLEGYVEGLIEAQMRIHGYNLIRDSLYEDIVKEIIIRYGITLGEEYYFDAWQIAADVIGMEVTARERELIIEKVSNYHSLTLYTTSEIPELWKQKELLKTKGYAHFEKEVPYIFYNSKINLNITSRTIESGITQRVFDILGCGGFCLTNYQPEIADYFKDGEELVMFSGMDDLIDKAGYYLKHEEERIKIASNGYQKVKNEFSLKERVAEMMQILNHNL